MGLNYLVRRGPGQGRKRGQEGRERRNQRIWVYEPCKKRTRMRKRKRKRMRRKRARRKRA